MKERPILINDEMLRTIPDDKQTANLPLLGLDHHIEIQRLKDSQKRLQLWIRLIPEVPIEAGFRQSRGICQLSHSHLYLSDRAKCLHDLLVIPTGDRFMQPVFHILHHGPHTFFIPTSPYKKRNACGQAININYSKRHQREARTEAEVAHGPQ